MLLVANDIPNATPAFALVMKPLEKNANMRAAEAERAMRLQKGDLEGVTAQMADGSSPASQPVEDRDEGGNDPSCAQGTCTPLPLLVPSLH